jgi:steroid 5-alpha reductase family enzyme
VIAHTRFLSVTPLALNLWICGAVTAGCWLASVLTREYSWTDRMWSIAPVIYAWVFAAGAGNPRATLVAVLVTAWGVRLTYNFARKGGYAPGGEDYRWAILRGRLPGWRFGVFNAAFIALYQNALLLAITLPVWTIIAHPGQLGLPDVVAAFGFVILLALETVADQQRWHFHRSNPGGGVLRTGLFRYSRHPNYFGEIGQWWVVFAFAAIAAGTPWLPTAVGAILLTLLFVGSTLFTEQISVGRHPEYTDYRRGTSMIIPWPPRSLASQLSEERRPDPAANR